MTVFEWRDAYPIRWPSVRVRAFWLALDPGVAIALPAGLLFAIVGAVTMVVSMPDGLRGSFIGVVFASVGVLLVGVAASIQTEMYDRRHDDVDRRATPGD